MNRLTSTLVQNKAIAEVTMMREADAFVVRMFKTQRHAAPASPVLESYLLKNGLVYRANGPLLALTYKGKQHAREIM